MIEFLDGPAACEVLILRRAPVLLRVVFNPRAKKEPWDALDQMDDQPKPHEEVHVYRRVGLAGRMHMRPGGCFATAKYAYYTPQPADRKAVRLTEAWQQWCLDQSRLSASADVPPADAKETTRDTVE